MESFPKKELIRVVRTPDGEVCIDATGKKSGRGAYICKKEECLAKARKSGRLKSSLECEITDAVYEQLAKEIAVELRMQN
jgi:predicted RNA-binding protein YlxR (DUF448 family)